MSCAQVIWIIKHLRFPYDSTVQIRCFFAARYTRGLYYTKIGLANFSTHRRHLYHLPSCSAASAEHVWLIRSGKNNVQMYGFFFIVSHLYRDSACVSPRRLCTICPQTKYKICVGGFVFSTHHERIHLHWQHMFLSGICLIINTVKIKTQKKKPAKKAFSVVVSRI